MTDSPLIEQLSQLPDSPGVYLMKDARGSIIYVGKAAVLRNRVRSYFASGEKLAPKTRSLVSLVADLEFYITASEQEALVLEQNLIKRHRPRFNIQLRDDKSYPYLKITLGEEWPRVYLTRSVIKDGSRYFGPFTSAWSLRQTIRVLRGVFPFRNCTMKIGGKASRVCLEYHMGRCPAPCTGAVSREEYAGIIRQVILFLEGKQSRIVKEIRRKMVQAAARLEFERAARLRNQLQALETVIEDQRITRTIRGEQDVIAFAQDKDQALVQVFFIREGKLTGRESFVLQGTRDEEPARIMASFVKQFYSSAYYIPPSLLLQYPAEDAAVIQDWLKSRRGSPVDIRVPRRGARKELMDTVAENARQGLTQLRIRQPAASGELEAALEALSRELGLGQPPNRIEGYDISDIQGTSAVGSMVVFEKGRPRPSHYRRFRIKAVAGANDYAMLQEVLRRRFKRGAGETGGQGWELPDLILIDGGKGQLSAALEVIVPAGFSGGVLSLAKEREEIFLPGKRQPLVLPATSPALRLLQRLRDEAHRFALGYYQRTHQRATFTSALDDIPGIGPRRKRALLKHFGSVPAIRDASVEEIMAATGMGPKQARNLKEHLAPEAGGV